MSNFTIGHLVRETTSGFGPPSTVSTANILQHQLDLDPQVMHSDLGVSIAREADYPVYARE